MFQKFASLLGIPRGGPPVNAPPASVPATALDETLQDLNRDPYLFVTETRLRLISVFDDLKYDRADLDMLSGPMRQHALGKLTPLGFRQVSGVMMQHADHDTRIHIPKIHALGASPFDATRYVARQPQDYILLTPTQVACQMVDHYPTEAAVEGIKALVVKHPINLLRLMDFLDRTETHEAFQAAIGHLKLVQREAIEREPLRTRRALR